MRTHSFHIVTPSPWPFLTAWSLIILTTGMVSYMHFFLKGGQITLFAAVLVATLMGFWWRDIIREGFQGKHTPAVMKGLRLGVLLFIVSEVFFFLAIFWAFFHLSLSPSIALGNLWPPYLFDNLVFSAFEIPLLNTVILLTSGATITVAHTALIRGDRSVTLDAFVATLFFALLFTFLQGFEYTSAQFSISDSAYGSIFYLSTGFHGFHVIIGTIFIFVCYIRFILHHFTGSNHAGFEFAAWYWHFVDVVWLFLFLAVYYWGNSITGTSEGPALLFFSFTTFSRGGIVSRLFSWVKALFSSMRIKLQENREKFIMIFPRFSCFMFYSGYLIYHLGFFYNEMLFMITRNSQILVASFFWFIVPHLVSIGYSFMPIFFAFFFVIGIIFESRGLALMNIFDMNILKIGIADGVNQLLGSSSPSGGMNGMNGMGHNPYQGTLRATRFDKRVAYAGAVYGALQLRDIAQTAEGRTAIDSISHQKSDGSYNKVATAVLADGQEQMTKIQDARSRMNIFQRTYQDLTNGDFSIHKIVCLGYTTLKKANELNKE